MKTTQERRDRIRAMIADYPGKRHEVTIHLLAGLLDDADRCAELEHVLDDARLMLQAVGVSDNILDRCLGPGGSR